MLLVVVDTLRKDHLPVYGYERRPTAPHLAELAAAGDAIVYDDVVAVSSWTKPTMATLFTGLPPAEHGVMRLVGRGARLQDPHVLAAEFAAAGYATGCVMGNHVLTRPMQAGFDAGFTFWDERPAAMRHEGTSARQVADSGLRWLSERPDDQPWFLVLHFFDPHAVFVDHPEYDWFDPDYGGPLRGGDSTDRLRELEKHLTAADREQLAALYDEEVRIVDDQFGRVLAALRARPDWERTVVVFTSDHGEELGERGHVGHTQTLHHELVDLPLVVRVPAAVAPRWELPELDDGGRSQLQLYAAMLRLGGIPVPAGRDALPDGIAMEVDFVPVRRDHLEKFVRKRGVQVGALKLVEDLNAGAAALYDRAADPGEWNPLPADDPRAEPLRRRLAEHRWWQRP